MVLFDQGTYDKLLSEVPKYKLVTPSILSDRMRVCLFLLFLSINFPILLNYFVVLVQKKYKSAFVFRCGMRVVNT